MPLSGTAKEAAKYPPNHEAPSAKADSPLHPGRHSVFFCACLIYQLFRKVEDSSVIDGGKSWLDILESDAV